MKDNINIEFTKEELLVLLDLIYRINSEKFLDDFFEDQAEQRILWDLESMLEKNTSNIFSGDYLNSLEKARESIRDKE